MTFISKVTTQVIDQFKVYRKGCWVNGNGRPVESHDDIKERTRKGARAHTINFELGALKTIFNLAINLPTGKKLMGHTDIQTTMMYAHLAPEVHKAAVDKLSF